MLKSVLILKMRGPNTHLDILFHLSDPKPVKGTHGYPQPFTTSRKPDIVVTTLQAAKRVADREMCGETWDSIAEIAAVDSQ